VIQQRVVAVGQLDIGKGDEGSEGHVMGQRLRLCESRRIVAGTRKAVLGRTVRGALRGRSRHLY
jgi:hypothetical protein